MTRRMQDNTSRDRSASELAEFARKMAELRRQQAAANEAVRRAEEAIRARGQFVPKQILPAKSIETAF
jgi:hypothetical protein